MNRLEILIKKAQKAKAVVVITEDNNNFKEYNKIVDEKGWEAGIDFLIIAFANSQIKKITESSRIKKDKKERVRKFWTSFAA